MKIAIDLGHGCAYDGGAVGIIKEEEIINTVGRKVIDKFKSGGHTVIECRPSSAFSTNDSLSKRCNTANGNNADLFISLHANAGKGTGTEIYTYKGEQTTYSKNILNNLVGIGLKNRGIKNGSGLAVINGTKMEAMLIEICFVDTQSDVDFYKNNIDNIVNAIVKGLGVNTSTIPQVETPIQNNTVQFNAHLRDLQRAYNNQYNKNILVDGLRGNQVESMLNTILLKEGSVGNCVGWVQCRTGATIDDVFGGNTKSKVIEFQRNNGLTQDGIVGKNTLNKLLEIFK